MNISIAAYIKEKASFVENKLRDYLDFKELPEEKLAAAMSYSLMAGGKRIRPVLMLAVTEFLGGNEKLVMPVACAVEMIHTYSLIHDDLPAIDNDDLRRGNPTCHVKYGEDFAILAGDTLQALAYQLLAENLSKMSVDANKIVKLVINLGQATGLYGMAGGQALDIKFENSDKLTLEELIKIHRLKTGALLEFSINAPLILFNSDSKITAALNSYAEAMGFAFQIKDDILDVDGSVIELGKTPGKDKDSNKATFVNLLGIDKAKEMLVKEIVKAQESIKGIYNAERLIELAQYLLERNN